MRNVAIIGGGISGLSLAEALGREARTAGLPLQRWIFDEADAPGGKVRSQVDAGFVIEAGPHGFLGREPAVFELIHRLGLQEEVVRADGESARRYLVRGGNLVELPMKPPAFLKSPILSPWGRARLVAEPLIPNTPPEDESVGDFSRRRLGSEATRVLIDAMVTGIYGGDPDRLSLPAAFPRMRELEVQYGSLIRAQFALAAERKDETPDGKARRESLHSFRRGLGTLTSRLAEEPERLELNAAVTSIEAMRPSGFRLRVPGGTLEVDAVVSTVPTFLLPQMIGALEPDLVDRVAEIDYAPVHVVVHGFKAADLPIRTDGFGFLAPHGEGRNILGCIWAHTVFPDHAPYGTVLLRTLVGGVRNRTWGEAKTLSILAAVRQELHDLIGLSKEARPLLERVIRWPQGIPQYEMGHLRRVAAADAIETRHPGLYLAGNGLRGVAMLDCVKNAGPLARRIVEGLAAARSPAAVTGAA